jgi:hypothetical protein
MDFWEKFSKTVIQNTISYSCIIKMTTNELKRNKVSIEETYINFENTISRGTLEIRHLNVYLSSINNNLTLRGSYRINRYEKSFETNFSE